MKKHKFVYFKKNYNISLANFGSELSSKYKYKTIDINCCLQELGYETAADPFALVENDIIHIFFETLKTSSNIGEKGDIAHMSINFDGNIIQNPRIIIKENFHLSYPQVFKRDSKIYLKPDSSRNGDMRFYVCRNFPYEWVLYKSIQFDGIDHTLISNDNDLFVFTDKSKKNAYTTSIDNFIKNNRFDNKNKNCIYKNRRDFTRPAGNYFYFNKRLYRPVQDSTKYYGEKTHILLVSDTNIDCYSEKYFITLNKYDWNSFQNHHYSFFSKKDNLYAITDGSTLLLKISFFKFNFTMKNKFMTKILFSLYNYLKKLKRK